MPMSQKRLSPRAVSFWLSWAGATKWKVASIVLAFFASATISAVLCESYLTNFVRIARCRYVPPAPDFTLISCDAVGTKFYYSGAMFLDIDQELIGGLREADVVILGNSRTYRTFASHAINSYFSDKGIRYFVLASEGSGFRFSQMILETLRVKPKILMINNESFYVDVLEDTNRDVVLYPDRFKIVLSSFYYSKKFLQWICTSSIGFLKSFYCSGKGGDWRSIANGTFYLDPNNYPDPPGHVPVKVPPETRMQFFNFFMNTAKPFLNSPSVKGACLINYVIPSNNSSVDLARRMAEAMGASFVYPVVEDLVSFDGSHLIIESSERWSAEFVKLVDPYVDECLNGSPATPRRPASRG